MLSATLVILSAAKDLTDPSAVQGCEMFRSAQHDKVTEQ